ncbi:MAG: hypothetical protein AVDCRST_MAG93-4148 [uncultured Chloroflexia bacterium]|uniref:Damage-inducible protein DinB n=1 Tax=uncultured Chloroflexia bacterium TaxID=1672391 RepID=A0A6J4K3K4_9CHLR|nr:MAG: hypothetical protein AVDCRST_MAG93-4148 [uncultured Chloroflexia bacterium]
MSTNTDIVPTFITPDALLEHWQGHRRLTRRVIEAFPEDKLFTFQPASPMRSFGALALEVIHMVVPTLEGLATGNWNNPNWEEIARSQTTKADVLALWDETTEALQARWNRLPGATFDEVHNVFGYMTEPGSIAVLYLIDNEIHHRAQGYVYLRLLGVEPPAFYER